MSAVPGESLLDRRRRMMIPGEVPSPISPPEACRFHTRCPFVKERCREEKQVLQPVGPNRRVACWRASEGEISTEDFRLVSGSLED